MKKIFSFILIILMMCSLTLAHSGRTDSKGGHYNRSTGEYHYHHGYSAHQHTDGICPYNYDNKISISSTTSNNSLKETKNGEIVENRNEEHTISQILSYIILFILFGWPLIVAVVLTILSYLVIIYELLKKIFIKKN